MEEDNEGNAEASFEKEVNYSSKGEGVKSFTLVFLVAKKGPNDSKNTLC